MVRLKPSSQDWSPSEERHAVEVLATRRQTRTSNQRGEDQAQHGEGEEGGGG